MDDAVRLKQLIGELSAVFPHNAGTQATARLYVDDLADLPIEVLEQAVRVLRRTSEFFPTIRAIRETVAEMMLGLPTEADALSQVEARVLWGRDRVGDPPDVHPLVREALDHVGGWHAFKTAQKPEFLRRDFLALFADLRAARIREMQVGRELAPGPTRRELPA